MSSLFLGLTAAATDTTNAGCGHPPGQTSVGDIPYPVAKERDSSAAIRAGLLGGDHHLLDPPWSEKFRDAAHGFHNINIKNAAAR